MTTQNRQKSNAKKNDFCNYSRNSLKITLRHTYIQSQKDSGQSQKYIHSIIARKRSHRNTYIQSQRDSGQSQKYIHLIIARKRTVIEIHTFNHSEKVDSHRNTYIQSQRDSGQSQKYIHSITARQRTVIEMHTFNHSEIADSHVFSTIFLATFAMLVYDFNFFSFVDVTLMQAKRCLFRTFTFTISYHLHSVCDK